MNSTEFIKRLEELKQTNLKFKYYYSYLGFGCFDEMFLNETQTAQYLIDFIKEDRFYESISYDTDDYCRRYISINDIIVKDNYLEFI